MIEGLKDQFTNALISADFKYHLKSEEKGDSWEEMNLADLYSKVKKHNIALGALIKSGDVSLDIIARKATDVILYTLMISERARMLKSDKEKEV